METPDRQGTPKEISDMLGFAEGVLGQYGFSIPIVHWSQDGKEITSVIIGCEYFKFSEWTCHYALEDAPHRQGQSVTLTFVKPDATPKAFQLLYR